VCKNFKPQYVQFGKRIQELAMAYVYAATTTTTTMSNGNTSTTATSTTTYPMIDIYAVSCAPNRPLCRHLEIDQYPFFRIYKPGDTEGLDVSHRQINPTTLLQLLMGITLNDDEEESVGTNDSTTIAVTNKASWLESIRSILLHHDFARNFNGSTKSTATRKYQMQRTQNELRDDIHMSFDYAMRHAVFTNDNVDGLDEDRATILKDWLHLLHKTIPISYTTLHACIQSLIDHFDYVKRSETYMLSILDEYTSLPNTTAAIWSNSCSYGMMDTGYACGLWLLFHTITVGLVDYNRYVVFAKHRLSTEYVATMIRNYIDAFFGCEVCRHNFVTSFDNCENERCNVLHSHVSDKESDWIQLPLWLLDTHNAVNVRLLKEKAQRNHDAATPTEDDIRKVIWPLQSQCSNCWLPNVDGTKLLRNNDAMYKFLKVEYGQRDALYGQYENEIKADCEEHAKQQLNSPMSYIHRFQAKLLGLIGTIRFQSGIIATLDKRKDNVHRILVTTLTENVFTSENTEQISSTKSAVCIEWLKLLRKALPIDWSDLHSLIEELLNNWMYVSKSKDYMFAILSEYPPPNDTRQKDLSIFDSMELLYVVTVGVVHYNKFVASTDAERLSTAAVARTIRNYADNICSKQTTQKILTESINSVCSVEGNCDRFLEHRGTEKDWIALPIWVFRLHNDILETQATETRKQSLWNVRWPSAIDCPSCWNDNNKRWNDDNVYKFLLLLYGQESTLSVGLRAELYGPSWKEITWKLHQRVFQSFKMEL
jgi:Erv1 / Alr family